MPRTKPKSGHWFSSRMIAKYAIYVVVLSDLRLTLSWREKTCITGLSSSASYWVSSWWQLRAPCRASRTTLRYHPKGSSSLSSCFWASLSSISFSVSLLMVLLFYQHLIFETTGMYSTQVWFSFKLLHCSYHLWETVTPCRWSQACVHCVCFELSDILKEFASCSWICFMVSPTSFALWSWCWSCTSRSRFTLSTSLEEGFTSATTKMPTDSKIATESSLRLMHYLSTNLGSGKIHTDIHLIPLVHPCFILLRLHPAKDG